MLRVFKELTKYLGIDTLISSYQIRKASTLSLSYL